MKSPTIMFSRARVYAPVCRVVVATLCLAYAFPQEASSKAAKTVPVEMSHGTVNVVIASNNALVLVTDSMLIDTGGKRQTTGLKLYKIDDKTICAMAGLYSSEGALGLKAFEMQFPQVVGSLIRTIQKHDISTESFANKVSLTVRRIQIQLTSSLQALVITKPDARLNDPRLALEITLAGYDLDGSLKVATVRLAPKQTSEGVFFESEKLIPSKEDIPLCNDTNQSPSMVQTDPYGDEAPVIIHTIGKEVFCEAVGLSKTANHILQKPSEMSRIPSVKAYARAMSSHSSLPVEQMESLALDLVNQTEVAETANHKFRVGGNAQIAVLALGRIVQGPPVLAIQDANIGSRLLRSQYVGDEDDCHGLNFMKGDYQGEQFSANLTNCIQELDGFVIHDSRFIDSTLLYYGRTNLLFSDNNVVTRTTLRLGPNVDLNRLDIKHLICHFPWKAVYQEENVVHPHCE